ncbi:metallophosphoesterase [Candidatus Dojkabacteria bacterium]|nr:metallophosphoesterase [Candidatus Dojkabacteria bacterium]
MSQIKKFKILIISCLLIVLVLLCVLLITAFVFPLYIEERTYEFESSLDLKIVFFGDIHAGVSETKISLANLVERINKLEPDLIIIGGDFIEGSKSDLSDLDSLSELDATYGVYAVLGNHDYLNLKEVLDKLDYELKIKLLLNSGQVIETTKGTLYLYGIDDIWNGEIYDPLVDMPSADYSILISHNPAVLYDTGFVEQFNLILASHTHGGQACVPIINYCPVWPFKDLERKYRTGLFDLTNDTSLIISSGVGENYFPLRIFVRPTIEIIKL